MKTLEELEASGAFDDRPSFVPIRSKRKQKFAAPDAEQSLSETHYADLVAIARGRIIDLFLHQTLHLRDKPCAPGFITGVGERYRDLLEHVVQYCEERPFVEVAHVNEELHRLPSGKQRIVTKAWQREFIEHALTPLYNSHHVWFIYENRGMWEIAQHCKDERAFRRSLLYSPFDKEPAA